MKIAHYTSPRVEISQHQMDIAKVGYEFFLEKKGFPVDLNTKKMGFIYVLRARNRDTGEVFLKIGRSINPLMRLTNHLFRTFPRKEYKTHLLGLFHCYDYKKCEGEIKKVRMLSGKEIIPTPKSPKEYESLRDEILSVVEFYGGEALDIRTVNILADTQSILKYFNPNGKD